VLYFGDEHKRGKCIRREREKEKRAIIEKKITLYIKIRWKRIKNREERKERDTA